MNMTMNKDFEMLKRDYDSCGSPKWSDPATKCTLCRIVYSILHNEYSYDDFLKFAKCLENGDFAKGCMNFVRNVLDYYEFSNEKR